MGKKKTLADYEAEGYGAHTWYLASSPYTQPKIRDAWQRGAWKWQEEQRAKKMPSKDSEIDFRFKVGGLSYQLRVQRDRRRGGYEALLLADGGGPIMMPNGTSPSDAVARLVRELTVGDAFDRKIAKEIVQGTGFPAVR